MIDSFNNISLDELVAAKAYATYQLNVMRDNVNNLLSINEVLESAIELESKYPENLDLKMRTRDMILTQQKDIYDELMAMQEVLNETVTLNANFLVTALRANGDGNSIEEINEFLGIENDEEEFDCDLNEYLCGAELEDEEDDMFDEDYYLDEEPEIHETSYSSLTVVGYIPEDAEKEFVYKENDKKTLDNKISDWFGTIFDPWLG